MKKLVFSLLLSVIAFSQDAFSQRICGTNEAEQNLLNTDPKYSERKQAIEGFTNDFVANYSGADRAVITIPVVVHVVYNSAAENISDAQVLSQIDVLNADFRKLNADVSNVPAAFAALAADSEIEFCMATIDPNGNPTNGITRTATTATSFGTNDQVKSTATNGVNAWPADQYLNIWVCDITGSILGYAQFPGGSAATDGVVIDYQYYGTIGTATAPFNLGRTASHEVGHWLNLRHIWGDDGTGCTGSDFVADTPNAAGPNAGCPTYPNVTCSNGPNGDMFMNYMDYTDDACMYMFTVGQAARMQAQFAPGGFREALGNSVACGDPATICNNPIALAESAIADNSATLSWAPVNGAATYDLRYREVGASAWIDVTGLTGTSYSLTGLTSCITYEWSVLTTCTNTVVSNFSTTRTFTTTGCPVSPYCESYGTTTVDEWIQSITLNTLTNNSGDNAGYAFFPSATTSLELGQTYTFEGTPGHSGTTYNESWRVWIDFNQDGDYLDAGEEVFTGGPSNITVNGNITIPSNALNGTTGMRVSMIFGTIPADPCEIFQWGEVEDYNITIFGCSNVSNYATANILDTEATISWDALPGVLSYTIQYGVAGSGVWTTVSGLTSSSYVISGLTACTAYEWQVQTACDASNTSAFSISNNFTTTGCSVSPYCESYGGTVDEWIDSIELNTINNVSGDNAGYAYFPAISTDLNLGQSYAFTGTPGYSGINYTETWSVWIDFNQDGDFLDAGESVYTSAGTVGTVNGSISIPNTAMAGTTGMRVTMIFGNAAANPCDIFQYGEVEDYQVNIVGCSTPANTAIANLSTTSVDLNWDATQSGNYTLRYSVSGAGVWTTITGLTNNTYAITGLSSCTSYDWQVRSNCDNLSFSAYSNIGSFITTGCTSTYCVPVMTSTGEYINRVQMNTIDNTSGNNGGYGNFTNISTTCQIGQTYSFSGTPGFNGTVRNERWRVWIDWNQDGDFNDAGEQLFTSGNTNTTYTNTFTVPGTALSGLTRMRVGMRRATQNPQTCPTSGNGEEEDYTILIINAAPNSLVQFAANAQTNAETSSTVSIHVPVELINESATNATSVEVYLASGNAARLVDASAQIVTWAAGETGVKNVFFEIATNTDCEGADDLIFGLQNVTGGTAASIVSGSEHTLTVLDDDLISVEIANDNFESGAIASWQTIGAPSWTASSANSINGTYALSHVNTGVANSNSAVALNVNNNSLAGVLTTWDMNVRNHSRAINASSDFMIYLATDNPDYASLNIFGYAIGVKPSLTSGLTNLTLFRLDYGVLSPILSSSFNINASVDLFGLRVTRLDNGTWTIYADANGGFDNLVNYGSAVDINLDELNYFGISSNFTSTQTSTISIDDLIITQSGCVTSYYSQSPGGDLDAAVWSEQPVGTGATIFPGRFTNLIIQSTAPVNVNKTLNAANLTIEDGSVLNGNNETIRLYGNLVINGAANFNAGTSTVIFKGDQEQMITGSGSIRLHNLTINNTSTGVQLNVPTTTERYIDPVRGVLYTNNNLSLASDANFTSGIGTIRANSDVIGNININRYLPSGPDGYVFLGATTVAATHSIENVWDDDLTTTGVAGSDFPNYNFINIYNYDETVPGGRNEGWVGMTNTSNLINPLEGYVLYQSSPALNVDVTGQFQKGDIDMNLSYTNSSNTGDGWNLLVNPYPCEVNWVDVETNSSDVNTYYYYDASMPGYRAYAANAGVGSGSQYIPHSMAFFVQATQAGQTLNFQELHKSNTNQAFERSTEEAMFIRFALSKGGQGDEAVLAFNENATAIFEKSFDAEKFESMITTSPEFAFVSQDNVLLNIDVRELPNELIQVPLYLDLPSAGDFVISFPEIQNIPFGSCISLEDTFTGIIYAIEEGVELTFSNDVAGYQGNRMVVRVTPSIQIATSNVACFNGNDGEIEVSLPNTNWSLSLENELGVIVYSGNTNEPIQVEAGQYTATVSSEMIGCTSVSDVIQITEPNELTYNSVVTPAICNDMNNGTVRVVFNQDMEHSWTLTDGNNSLVQMGEANSNFIEIENIAAGNYTLVYSNECEVVEMEVVTIDPNAIEIGMNVSALEIEIPENGTALIEASAISENVDQLTWSVNGNPVAYDPSFAFEINQAGTFNITLNGSNEFCEAAISQTVQATMLVDVTEASQLYYSLNLLQNEVTVKSNGSTAPYSVNVTAMNGQVVFMAQGISGDSIINSSDWAAGVYHFNVFNENGILIDQKVIR